MRKKAEALLVLVTFIWGSTFVIVKEALNDASPLAFLALRFTLAGVLLFALLASWPFDPRAIVPGLVQGVLLFGGYVFQTWGLLYTTPSKAAFITGFSVILVPLLLMLAGSAVRGVNVAGALLGLAGIYFLVLPSNLAGVNRGDALTIVGAVSFALHIVMVARYAKRFSYRHLVPAQILGVGLLSMAALAPVRVLGLGRATNWTPRLMVALLVTAVLATGLAFSVQNWAQQFTPPAHTALIFALEPVFAALTSRWVVGERLGGKTLLGCGLILTGMVVSEVWGGSAPSPVES